MTPTIELPGRFTIGGDRTFVIAEIGSNHAGDLQRALDTIDAAAEAGADAAKFQSLCLEEQWHQPSAELIALHRKIDLNEDWYPALRQRCDRHGLIFFSAPTYFRAVDRLESLDVPLYKLASAQIGTFPQIVQRVGRTMKPVLLSTGIVTTPELDQIVARLESTGNRQFAILHCNSIYPTPVDKVHLPRMTEYGKRYRCPVGFSDHTQGINVPVAAVAMGAKIIEKHFLLDRKQDCPDAPFSLEPEAFQMMTGQIRQVEQAMRPAERTELEPEERDFKQLILQKLVLNHPKSKGDRFRFEDFLFRRHPHGIDCRQLDVLLADYVAGHDLAAGELLEWNQLHKVSD